MAVILAGMLLTAAHLPVWFASRAELIAGVTLIALGIWTVNGIRRRGLHVHMHAHDAHRPHAHFHIHATAGEHEPHLVPPSLVHRPATAYAIGTLHGLAGSGAAVALTTLAAPTRGTALLYLLCFGIGSLLGMAAVGLIALWPVFRMVTYLPRARSWIQGVAGIGSVVAGLLLIARVGIL